ncbi:membrane protein [Flammeovirga sp. OC4]|uniref:membrane protein n=1 Tax=Flammeovirga sp. OC4 TaxID=1382345 RepID=UPI0005C5240F|nr:membrane protein [Flammeovirga sp. OC4]
MAKKNTTAYWMRIIHRYLGFFLAGIMAVYSFSGIILIFRDTDFLKRDYYFEKTVDAGLEKDKIGKAIGVRRLKVSKVEGDLYHYKQGTYNVKTGEAKYTLKKQPYMIEKMNHMHKATSGDPLFFLNIFFGVSLFFFVLSTFWMFAPKTKIFKKGMYFTLGGIALTLFVLFFE